MFNPAKDLGTALDNKKKSEELGNKLLNTTYKTTTNKYGDTSIRTRAYYRGKEYPIFLGKDGTYYIITSDKNDGIIGVDKTSMQLLETIKKNNDVTVNLDKGANHVYNPNQKTETKTETKPKTETNTNTGGGVNTNTPDYTYYTKELDKRDSRINELEARIDELTKPMSAKEAAELYGLTDLYNEANILKDYNKATNDYYNEAVDAQEGLRSDYARNNAQYMNQLVDTYIDSYQNKAPTAMGKGAVAANALTTMLNANAINNENDYGMMQSVNSLEEARKAELKNNPNLAKQYYNKIGTYLSTLSATKNASDVKQAVDELDAYGQRYAADRYLQAAEASAAATKYSGLANATATNASANAARSNSTTQRFQNLYNYYYNRNNQNADAASKAVATLLNNSTGGTKAY